MTGSPSRARRLSEGWSANFLQMVLGIAQQVALVPVFLLGTGPARGGVSVPVPWPRGSDNAIRGALAPRASVVMNSRHLRRIVARVIDHSGSE